MAEFADYYFDVDLAAEIWAAAQVAAAPEPISPNVIQWGLHYCYYFHVTFVLLRLECCK